MKKQQLSAEWNKSKTNGRDYKKIKTLQIEINEDKTAKKNAVNPNKPSREVVVGQEKYLAKLINQKSKIAKEKAVIRRSKRKKVSKPKNNSTKQEGGWSVKGRKIVGKKYKETRILNAIN